MRNTSSTRRIDSLGRVVIPKQFRQSLRLFSGSFVDVVKSEDKIIITPSNNSTNFFDIAKLCASALTKTDLKVFVCNTKSIVCGEEEIAISEKLFEIINSAKTVILRGNEKLGLTKNSQAEGIFPINQNGVVCGAICVVSTKYLDNFDFVVPFQKFLNTFLSE